MFREKALVKLKSPEQLDEPLKVIRRPQRVAVLVVVAVLGSALAWGILGRLPETGYGQGILITKGTVRPIQAGAGGQIAQWFVKVGDRVAVDQAIGLLEQPVARQELEQAEERLAEIMGRNEELQALRQRYSDLERRSIADKRRRLTTRIAKNEGYIERGQGYAQEVRTHNARYLVRQRKNLKAARESALEAAAGLAERLASYERLRGERLASDEAVTNARRSHEDAKLRVSDIELQLQELRLSELRMQETFQQATNLVSTRENELAELRLQLQELDNRVAQLDKQDQEIAHTDQSEIEDLRRSIQRYRDRLERDRNIRTPFAGRILELTVAEGNVISQGRRLAQIDTRQETDTLIAMAYFMPKSGKQLDAGDRVRVSPTTASQQIYGNIIGLIRSVSPYSVTSEAVANTIGSQALASAFIDQGFTIEVEVELVESADTFSGFAWTSTAGPPLHMTAGTKAAVWVTLEQRRPISYVLPKLREWSGL